MFEMIPFRKNNNSLGKRGDYFDTFFENFLTDNFFSPSISNRDFKVDVKDTENAYLIETDLPGINKENIDVSYDNGYLTITAKREDIIEDKKDNYVRRERSYGEFRRSFYIDDVDENNIQAKFENGVLMLNLPKAESKKQKKIDIQ